VCSPISPGLAAIRSHNDRTSGGSVSVCLMKATTFQISSSDSTPSHVGMPLIRMPCLVTQNNHASSSCGMRSMNCGAGGLNLSRIGLIDAFAPPWQKAQCSS